MLMLNRKRSQIKKTLGISLAVLAVAHVAAGVLLCASSRCSSLERMAKKAKRTVTGFVREMI